MPNTVRMMGCFLIQNNSNCMSTLAGMQNKCLIKAWSLMQTLASHCGSLGSLQITTTKTLMQYRLMPAPVPNRIAILVYVFTPMENRFGTDSTARIEHKIQQKGEQNCWENIPAGSHLSCEAPKPIISLQQQSFLDFGSIPICMFTCLYWQRRQPKSSMNSKRCYSL